MGIYLRANVPAEENLALIFHFVKQSELAGDENSTRQKVRPLDQSFTPIDIIRSKHLKGLVEPDMLFQKLDRFFQDAFTHAC